MKKPKVRSLSQAHRYYNQQVGPGEVGPNEVGPDEVGPCEVGPNEVGPNEVVSKEKAKKAKKEFVLVKNIRYIQCVDIRNEYIKN